MEVEQQGVQHVVFGNLKQTRERITELINQEDCARCRDRKKECQCKYRRRGGQIRNGAIVLQQKAGRPVQFGLKDDARSSLLAWLERRGGTIDDYAFPSRVDHADHIGTRQYARLVDEWVTGIGLGCEDYGTHSLRRTKASIIYKATGNLRAVQILLGHTKIESTVRYLGVDVEDALRLAEATDI